MKKINEGSLIAIPFIWIGFICAISFMEAWLKFQAPGITIPLGLGIGRLVFHALNRVEWVCAIIITISILSHHRKILKLQLVSFIIVLIILMMQTFWLLPALDQRAEMHIQGQEVPPSNMHFYYIIIEFLKLVFLFVFGITLLNKVLNKIP